MRPALIAPLLALAWGLNWPAVRIMLGTLPPFSMRWLGLGLGAVLLALVALGRRQSLRPLPGAWPGLVCGALLTVAGFNFFTAFAQLSTSTSRAAVLTFTMPLMCALLAWAWLGERPGRRGAWALALGGLGVFVLAWPVLAALTDDPNRPGVWQGLAWPLLAAASWATGTVATKRWPLLGDRLVLTAWQLAIGAGLAAVAAAISGERLPATWPAAVVGALLFHVVVATALAYVLWYGLLARLSATASSLTILAVPVVGVLGAMALVGERPVVADWLGFALVMAGALLATPGLGAGLRSAR